MRLGKTWCFGRAGSYFVQVRRDFGLGIGAKWIAPDGWVETRGRLALELRTGPVRWWGGLPLTRKPATERGEGTG
jgi:hypothetical protein